MSTKKFDTLQRIPHPSNTQLKSNARAIVLQVLKVKNLCRLHVARIKLQQTFNLLSTN